MHSVGLTTESFNQYALINCLHQKIGKKHHNKTLDHVHVQPGPNFIELLKQKILLKQKNLCFVKSDYRLRLHLFVMLSKQQLNISH